MDKNKIVLLGNPLLRQISQPITEEEFGTPELKQLEQELFAMLQAEKGLGLAAPQIGISNCLRTIQGSGLGGLHPVSPF